MSGLRLSVLDQSPVSAGSPGSEALRNSLDLARLADELGYHRYWVAEHHGGGMVAGTSPEVLLGPIAAATRHLRVGSGGVMLPHYSAFKVAEAFSVLAGLYGDRIDLGLGRASGTDPMTAHVLQRDRSRTPPDDFPEQLAELLAHLEDRLPDGHPAKRLAELPGLPHRPEPWLLGSSAQSGIWAAELGLPYAFADFINPRGAAIARSYVRDFQESAERPAPRLVVAAWVLAADTDEEARRLAAPNRMAFALLRAGRPEKIPPVDQAIRFLESRGESVDSPAKGRRQIVGSPETVKAGVEQVAEEYGTDEVVVVTITHGHEERRRSYELLADAFGLERRPVDRATVAA